MFALHKSHPSRPVKPRPRRQKRLPIKQHRFEPVFDEHLRLIGVVARGGAGGGGAEGLDRFRADIARPIPSDEHQKAVPMADGQTPIIIHIPQGGGAQRIIAAVEREVDTGSAFTLPQAQHIAERGIERAEMGFEMVRRFSEDGTDIRPFPRAQIMDAVGGTEDLERQSIPLAPAIERRWFV